MNRDEIITRITAISNEMLQVKANFAKLEGHLSEAQHWLAELDKKNAVQQEPIDESKEQENGEVDHQSEEQAA